MTTNFTPAEQQAIEICEADGVCLSPSVMLNSLELLGFKPESATGDAVCRNPKDTTDQWVVRRELFNSTYSVN